MAAGIQSNKRIIYLDLNNGCRLQKKEAYLGSTIRKPERLYHRPVASLDRLHATVTVCLNVLTLTRGQQWIVTINKCLATSCEYTERGHVNQHMGLSSQRARNELGQARFTAVTDEACHFYSGECLPSIIDPNTPLALPIHPHSRRDTQLQ
ncbi:hypothetical protein J6590_004042 [Homalodisca vitripennis]|nr:hypothetical protein J6590_004042 [Homalodisca vitripennis]